MNPDVEQIKMQIREWKDELEDARMDCNRNAIARAKRNIKKLTEKLQSKETK